MSINSKTYLLGLNAEELVAQHFKSIGFSVLARRYKTKYGEIDLIIQKAQQIIFVEVKARNRHVSIENLLTPKQIQRNYFAAEIFLSKNPQYECYECRFDLIFVQNNKILNHIQNVMNDF